MTFVQNILTSFLGGLELHKAPTQFHWIIVYAVLYAFYCVYFYVPFLQTKNARLIGCGILLCIILFLKLAFLILRFLISLGFENETIEKTESPEEICPTTISSDVWCYREQILNADSIDNVVNDLIVSGVDPSEIINLVEYLRDTNQFDRPNGRERHETANNNLSYHKTTIKIGNHIFTIPFTIHQIDRISPSSPSLICIIISVIFGFSASYLLLSLTPIFVKSEKWVLSFVLASSTFSIIQPPNVDPFNTSINDAWNSCARPFLITLFSSAWRLILDFLCTSVSDDNLTCSSTKTVIHELYGITINWPIILPYIFIIFRIGIYMTLVMFFGYLGHPITSLVAILESSARYFLGQNGAGGFLHIFVQLLRGSASVAAVWGLQKVKVGVPWEEESIETQGGILLARITRQRALIISCCIAVSTFINLFPVMLNKFLLKHWVSTFFFPLLATLLSFCFPCLVTVGIRNYYSEIRYFCLAWLILFEMIFPYLYSANKYFCFHFLIIPPISFISIFRYVSSLIIAPLYLSLSLQTVNIDSPLHILVFAFLVTHAVHKMHSECHVFALAAFICSLTFPKDFGKDDPAVNLLLSLLISARLETAVPVVRVFQSSRYFQLFLDELFELDDMPYFAKYFFSIFINRGIILVDIVVKFPTLVWTLLFGGGFGPAFGIPYLLMPHPLRPNYFFDWPKNLNVYSNISSKNVTENGEEEKRVPTRRSPTALLSIIFEKNVNDHPVETPVYMSAVRSIAKSIGSVIKSGRLGYVNGGNMYLFKSKDNNAAFFLHVISVEPTCLRLQLRGLEYKNQTLCHEGEETNLNEIANEYEFDIFSTNTHAAFAASATDYDFRSYSVCLSMYDVSTTPLNQAFIGIEDSVKLRWFIYAFAFSLKKFICSNDNEMATASELNLSINENSSTVQERVQMLSEVLAQKFSQYPANVDDYQYIRDIQNVFDKIVGFFINADSEGNQAASDGSLSSFHFNDTSNDNDNDNNNNNNNNNDSGSNVPFLKLLFNLFACLVASIFDKNGKIVLQNAPSNFGSGKLLIHNWAVEFVGSIPSKVRQTFLKSFLQRGYIYCFLASSSVIDQGTLGGDTDDMPEDDALRDVFQQLVELDDTTVIAPINSPYFIREFTVGDRMLIAITGEKILRFAIASSKWCVFQINQEYARGIWAQEARDILFFGNEDSERMSIQENIYFLNNLLSQACETPIGYPAYSSEIFEAYANPLMKNNLVFE